jgi:hypothetical protein
MRTAFPSSDYYDGSAPCRARRASAALPTDALAARQERQTRQGSHVHHAPIDGGGAQLCSDSLAASTPQTFLAAFDDGINDHHRSRLTVNPLGARCCPALIHQVGAGSTITEVQPLVHSRYTFPSCLPDPGRLAVPTDPGVVRAASHPPRRLPDQAALSFNPAAATTRRWSPLTPTRRHGASWRTVITWNASRIWTASGSWSRIAFDGSSYFGVMPRVDQGVHAARRAALARRIRAR